MRKALLSAALVALLGLIVDARPLSAQYIQAQPPFGAAPAPMMTPGTARPGTAEPGMVESRTVESRRAEARREARRAEARRARAKAARARAARTAARSESSSHKHEHSPPDTLKSAEKDGYKRLSDLVNFPKFFPGLGIVFVKPDSLPLGPFLCFDRDDRLIATVYMVSIKDIDDHKAFEAPGFGVGKVDHISYYFNSGHPGMDMPHYHIVIWHVSKEEEARAAH